jgi:hypothetical protein
MILGFVALLFDLLPMKEQKNGFKHSGSRILTSSFNSWFDYVNHWFLMESCGLTKVRRYWGWDQETWALIYYGHAFVIHARFVPTAEMDI